MHEDQVLIALRRIVRAIDIHSRRLFEQCGLTGPQLATLRAAWSLGDAASAGAVARSIHLSQPTVSGILDRLERQELLTRTRDDSDRRNVLIQVTPAGERVLRSSPSLLQDRFIRALRALQSWEQSQMLATLQRIAFMMDAEEIEAAPLLVTGSVDFTSTSPPPDREPAKLAPASEAGVVGGRKEK